MDARDSTAANADLWNAYLRAQWRAWLDPLGPSADDVARSIADAAAANIATAVSAMLATPIARMYADNAPTVTRFVAESGSPALPPPEHVVIPPDYTRRHAGDSQIEAGPEIIPDGAILAY